MTTASFSIRLLQPLSEWYYRMASQDAVLEEQLNLVGVVQPLLGVERREGIGLVDGFRRYRWLKQQGIESAVVQVFAESEASKAFLCGLSLNHWARPLSLVEKDRALHLARDQFGEGTWEEVVRLLGIPPARKIYPLLVWLDQLPAPARGWLHQAGCSIRQVERLRAIKILEFPRWVEAAQTLRLKAQECLQLAEQLWEVALRERTDLDSLYTQLEVSELLADQRTLQQKQHELKRRIEKARFPLLKTIQHTVETQLQHLPRPAGQLLRFTWDRSLERPGIGLQAWIANEADLDRLHNLLSQSDFKASFKQALKNIQQIE